MWFRKVEMEGNMKLHVIHVAGFHMINDGVETLSRGEISKGVMKEKDIPFSFSFIRQG